MGRKDFFFTCLSNICLIQPNSLLAREPQEVFYTDGPGSESDLSDVVVCDNHFLDDWSVAFLNDQGSSSIFNTQIYNNSNLRVRKPFRSVFTFGASFLRSFYPNLFLILTQTGIDAGYGSYVYLEDVNFRLNEGSVSWPR